MLEIIFKSKLRFWIEDFPRVLVRDVFRHFVGDNEILESKLKEVEEEAQDIVGCFEYADLVFVYFHLFIKFVHEVWLRPIQIVIKVFRCNRPLLSLQ